MGDPMAPVLERSYQDADCGCPVEEWICRGIELQLHFEADGTMEAYADAGEWDINLPLKATTMIAAREEAFAWVRALPAEAAQPHHPGADHDA